MGWDCAAAGDSLRRVGLKQEGVKMQVPNRILALVAALSVVATACGGGSPTSSPAVSPTPAASPTASAVGTPTATPKRTLSPTPTATPTLSPRPTPTLPTTRMPTSTPKSTPKHTLSPTPTPTPTSGEYILYGGSSGSAWVIRPDGTGKHKLAAMMPVSWSHDGSAVHLLHASGCSQTLANVSVFGGPVHPVAAALKVGDTGFTWSADDHQIAFFRYVTEHQCSPGGSTDDTVHLMVMNADGSNIHKVGPVLPDAGQVGWLPDGKSVVVNTSDQMNSVAGPLIRVNLSNGAHTNVTTGACQEYQFALTRDGHRIAWTCDDGAHVAGITGSGDHPLGHTGWRDHLLAWSPNSVALAILRVEPSTVHLAVWKSPAALPTDLYNPLNDNVMGPKFSWSPDSKRIACVGTAGQIILVHADGSGSTVVPGSTGSWAADWQP